MTRAWRLAPLLPSLVLAVALGLALGLAGCETDPSLAPTISPAPAGGLGAGPSGIEGTVLRGPICPVEREDEPCPDEPFSAFFHVFDLEWNGIAKFHSTEEGWFHIALPPGDYVIEPDESAPLMPPPAAHRVVVTVPESGFATVTLSFDTGIR